MVGRRYLSVNEHYLALVCKEQQRGDNELQPQYQSLNFDRWVDYNQYSYSSLALPLLHARIFKSEILLGGS